jgi:UDP-glucose:(heptosyl)LPS alpha-1,3-glucosyltransferase
MKLALCLEWWNPEGGGAERSAHQIAAALVERGHEVAVLAGWASGTEPLPGITVEHAPSNHKLRTAWDALRFHRWVVQRLDAGGFEASLSFTTLAPATLLQPRAGILRENHARAVAVRRTGVGRICKRLNLALNPKQQVMLRIERQVVVDPRVRRFVAISGYMARQLHEHYHVDEQRTAPGCTRRRRCPTMRRSSSLPASTTAARGCCR